MAKDIGSFEIKTDYSREDWRADEEYQLTQLREQLQAANSGELVGEVVRWQRADGYAQYMVASQKPLQLVHLAVGDAWSVEDALIRGLRLTDIRKMVERERGLKKLFATA